MRIPPRPDPRTLWVVADADRAPNFKSYDRLFNFYQVTAAGMAGTLVNLSYQKLYCRYFSTAAAAVHFSHMPRVYTIIRASAVCNRACPPSKKVS